MWARRCGAPAKWPSRIKVTLMSVGALAIGLAVFQLFHGDDISYLDLEKPVKKDVLCLRSWPLRTGNPLTLLEPDLWEEWVSYRFDVDRFIEGHKCSVPKYANVSCHNVEIPLSARAGIGRKLGRPLGIGDTISYDFLNSYAWLFLLLAGWLWLQVLAHDLSLLASANKDFVLDLIGIKEQFPCVRLWFRLTGFACLRACCCNCQTRGGKLVAVICMALWAPIALVWSVFFFLGVAVPCVAVIFLWYPARMSRFGAFLASLACAFYGLILAIHNLVYLCFPESRAKYAVTWVVAGESPCDCGCVYPLSTKIVWQFALIGGVTVVRSLFLAMRCLKGLRRSNWANLLSVTFPVPVAAYAVEWSTPGGKPIRFRTEDGPMKPVQGELAFDPFAMMDEQPDSELTTLHLKPVKANRLMYSSKGQRREIRKLEGPNAAVMGKVTPGEYIGCCGFPCRTGGTHAHFDIDDSDSEMRVAGGEGVRQPHLAKTTTLDSSLDGSWSFGSACARTTSSSSAIDPRRDAAAVGGSSSSSARPHLQAGATGGMASAAEHEQHPRGAASPELLGRPVAESTSSRCSPLVLPAREESPLEGICEEKQQWDLERLGEFPGSADGAPAHMASRAEASAGAAGAREEAGCAPSDLFGEEVGSLGLEVAWPHEGPPVVRAVETGSEAELQGFAASTLCTS